MDIGKLIGMGVVGFVVYEMFFKHSSTAGSTSSGGSSTNASGSNTSTTTGSSGGSNASNTNSSTTVNTSTTGTVQGGNQASNSTGSGSTQTVSASGFKNNLILNMNALGFNPNDLWTQDQWNYFLSTTKVGGNIVASQFTNPGDLKQGHTRKFGIDEYVALLTSSGGVHGLSGLGKTNHSPLTGYEKLFANMHGRRVH